MQQLRSTRAPFGQSRERETNFSTVSVVTRGRVGTREMKLMGLMLVSFGFNILEIV
jgi:hypothetical protein